MGRPGLKVSELYSVEELVKLRKALTRPAEVLRITAIIMLLQERSSALKVSQKLNTNHESVREWVKSFNQKGLDGIRDGRMKNRRGNTFKTDSFLRELDKLLSGECIYGGIWTGEKLKKWINEKYGKKFVISTIYSWMHEIGYSWKTPRPEHIKGNKEEQDKFKKNIPSARVWNT